MKITGSTKVYLIAADPIVQVRAPEVFNHVFERTGVDAVLVPVHVKVADIVGFVREAFKAANVHGMFLTIPHKAEVIPLLDRCDKLGLAAGAVNGIRRNADGSLEGGQFDGLGFVGGLDYYGIPYRGRSVLIVGAGGAAAAIAACLAQSGAAAIALFDPLPGKAAEVAARVQEVFGVPSRAVASSSPRGFELVVNASPLGMKSSDPLPFDVSLLDQYAAVVDILMKNQPTPLVRAARAAGRVAEPGFEMLIQQTPFYLEFFGYFDAAAQVRADGASIRELLYPAELRHEWQKSEGLVLA